MSLRRGLSRALLTGGLAAATPLVAETRIGPATRAVSERWQTLPIRRGNVRRGLSFRPRQAEDLGLDVDETLDELLAYPFPLIRLSAYWDRVEPTPDSFDTGELDRHLEKAERAGKEIILGLGGVKSFGYPEYFVPEHALSSAIPEGHLVDEHSHPQLLRLVTEYLTRLVDRYRNRTSIRAWQIEHDAVDPLGMEHSWRLSKSFVAREVETVAAADPSRAILLNGFLPTSTAVAAQQWWGTRGQGDSLTVACELADIVGVDYYPRHAVVGVGDWSVYLAGRRGVVPARRRTNLLCWARDTGRELVVTEGQAEPWEAITVPPSPLHGVAASCPPERLIENYNDCLRWIEQCGAPLSAYLFWGAEYWIMRDRQGDPRYLRAFARVLGS